MPSTVNGIGTHYYGKKNQSVRNAACRSCNRVGNLESYDTRLWFVIVFIPVIPLGRKRILDACPSCTRHYVVKADVYEQTKQLQTSASLDRFRRESSTDSAIEAHGQLLGFHEYQQAAEFRQTALAKFPDHAGLRAGMAAQLRDMSSYQESAKLFHEALELDPALPEARVGVAQWLVAEGNFGEARRLLDFLMEPGVGRRYSLVPLDQLAGGLQQAGHHEEALVVAEVLLRELPKLADEYTFRKFVKVSEKAVGRPDSILPDRGFSLGGLFRSEGSHYPPWLRKLTIGVIATFLIAVGLAVNNEFIKGHRTLHVVNATGQAAQVQVDDQPAVSVSGLGKLTVPEGSHIVKVTGPVSETRTIALGSGYFERWTSNPAWILNLGGEAVLEDITHVYSAKGIPGHRHYLVGETFVNRPHVDYIFTAAPSQMQVKSKTQEITKTEVGWVQSADLNAFMETVDSNHQAAMDFAEKRLRRNANQGELLKYYLGQAHEDERGRIEKFLRSGLDRRPVDISWHRAYQSIAEVNNHKTEMISLYDKSLAEDPASAAFCYLRGRIEPDPDKQTGLLQKSIEADPKLGYSWLAFASKAESEGRWSDCRDAAQKARALNVNESDRIAELLHEAAMGAGETKSLVGPYRTAANTNMQDPSGILYLLDALAASGQEGEIDQAIKTWAAQLPSQFQGQITPQMRALGLYYAGKLDECVEFCRSNPALRSSQAYFHALIALGRSSEAAEDPAFAKLWVDPTNLLALSVGFGLDGKAEDSKRWREKALGLLSKLGQSDIADAAKLLASTEPPPVETLRGFHIPLEARTLILASLAVEFPVRRAIYLAEASKFNIRRKPPYQLILKATEAKPPGQP